MLMKNDDDHDDGDDADDDEVGEGKEKDSWPGDPILTVWAESGVSSGSILTIIISDICEITINHGQDHKMIIRMMTHTHVMCLSAEATKYEVKWPNSD